MHLRSGEHVALGDLPFINGGEETILYELGKEESDLWVVRWIFSLI